MPIMDPVKRLEYMRAYRLKHIEKAREQDRIGAARRRATPEGGAKHRAASRKYWDSLPEEKRREKIANHVIWQRETGYHREWMRRHREVQFVVNAVQRAKRFGLPFDLTEADIEIPEVCPALGIKLEMGPGRIHRSSPVLDRLVPALGYVRGNVCVISASANTIKRDRSLAEMEAYVALWQRRVSRARKMREPYSQKLAAAEAVLAYLRRELG